MLRHCGINGDSEEATEPVGVGHRRDLRVVNLLERGDLGLHVSALETDVGSLIAHLVAVVRRGEDCEALATLLVLVARHLHLVRAHYQLYNIVKFKLLTEFVLLEELLCHIRPKHAADAALARKPAGHVAGVRPEAVDHDALVGRLLEARRLADILKRHVVLCEETAVRHEDFGVDAVAQRQVLEQVVEELVHLCG